VSRYCATFVSILIILPPLLTSSVQTGSFGSIEDHYFGASLFIAPTGNVVWLPVAVSNLDDYVSIYGQVDSPGPPALRALPAQQVVSPFSMDVALCQFPINRKD